MFEHYGLGSQPAEGDRLFAWVFIPTTLVCQITPHYFGLTHFLAWEVESNAVWFFLAAMLALLITFVIIGLINFIFWVSDRLSDAGPNADRASDTAAPVEQEPNSEPKK